MKKNMMDIIFDPLGLPVLNCEQLLVFCLVMVVNLGFGAVKVVSLGFGKQRWTLFLQKKNYLVNNG